MQLSIGKFLALFVVLISLPLVGPAQAEDLTIPCLFGLTGPSAQFGKGELDAVTLAADEWNQKGGINGRKIKLEVEDTTSDQARIVTAYKKFVDLEHARFILGPTWLDSYQAIVPLAERQQVMLLTPSAEGLALHPADKMKSFSFTTYYSSKGEVLALLEALQHAGIHKVSATYTNDPFFLLLRDIVNEHASQYGIKVLSDDTFEYGFTDFKSYAAKIKKLDPDALLLFQTDVNSIIELLRASAQLNFRKPVVDVHDLEGFLKEYPQLLTLAPTFYHGTYVIADQQFLDRFNKRYGYSPILTHTNAYDAANMLFSALAAGKSTASEIRDFLLSQEFNTVTFGKVKFLPEGRLETHNVKVVEVHGKA